MAETLRAPGLRIAGIDHGFAAPGEQAPPAYVTARVRQVHGTAALWASGDAAKQPAPATSRSTATAATGPMPAPLGEADALLTSIPGIAVAISTADCVPMLIAAPDAGVVAAVHAGWRGTLDGIGPAVVRELRERCASAPERLRVALGPSIGACCFEIERAIAQRFAERWGAAMWAAWRDGRDDGVARGTLDLRDVNRRLLEASGVPAGAIELVGPCTYCGHGFASFRRDGANAGRQLSWIAVTRAA